MNLGCSSEKTDTSSSATETKKIPSHVVNLKESKTHLFYVIQSDNESHAKTQHLVELKISKEIPSLRKSVWKKMRLRHGNSDDAGDENREKAKRTQIPSRLASIQKRTDHPSFVVLPQVLSRRHFNVRQNVEKNQSTSENSNETYVIRSKEDNKTWGSRGKMPMLFGSLWKRNSDATVDATYLHGLKNLVANPKSEEYCECDKGNNLDDKIEKVGSAQNTSKGYLKKEDLFNINFAKPTHKDMPQRLRAGQDRRYKSCSMCPDMTRIFPPTSSRRPTAFQADIGSNSTLNNRSGYAKINFILVRQCLIYGLANEKTEILDAIRLRMRSSDSNVAIGTIDDIVTFDLFGVQCECRSKPILEELFWPLTPSHELQTSIARFVNALVSYKIGRNYFNKRSVIHMLTWGDIGRDNIDPIMGDNLIGILMKLSFSRFQRTDMIKNGLLRWLLQHMQEREYSASAYHLQCMAGLLRNLLRGFNLESFSPTEMKNLIVLLGRYLDHENGTAKRYIFDSLMTVFQNLNCVASAKNLNFHRVIQEHVTNAANPAQREHLSALYHLLNGSASSTSFKAQKVDTRSEEETFLDEDLEPGGEVDCYPGECLIREKFTGDAGMQRQEKTADETNAMASDDSDKSGRLISRVFVEHLNCFLPNIESNRIFPLCNSRCADKIRTCSHVGDIQQRKRQPYIPPNSRLPRQKQSVGVSVEEMLAEDYNKSMRKSQPSDKESKSIELLTSRVSTISHDTTAAKWHQIGKGDENAELTSLSADTDPMEKIFEGRSIKANNVLEDERIIATESYDQETFGAADVSNKRRKNDENILDTPIKDRLSDQQSPDEKKVRNTDEELAATAKTKNREVSQRNSVNTKSVEGLELTEGQKISQISGDLTQRKKHELDSTVSEQKIEKLKDFSSQQNLLLDKGSRRQLSLSSSFNENDDRQKHLFEESRLKESSVNRDTERGETSRIKQADHQLSSSKPTNKPMARHSSENSISQQGTSERKQTRTGGIETGGIETGRGIDTKSEETLTNLGRDEKTSRMTEVTETTHEYFARNETGRQYPVRSKEMVVKTKTGQDPLLNVRSERLLKKTGIETTSKVNAKEDANETGINLKVRSEEGVKNTKSRGDKSQEDKSTNQKLHPALQARSEAILVKTAIGNTNKKVVSPNSNEEPVSDIQTTPQLLVRSAKMLGATQGLLSEKSKDTVAQGLTNIAAKKTGNMLNAPTENLVAKQIETKERSPSSLIESRTTREDIVTQQITTPQLHARSMEMLKNNESSNQLLRKSRSDVMNIDANANRRHNKTQHLPGSSQPTTNVIGQTLQARSVEYERPNYQLLKSSSDDLLGSTRNQVYSLESTGNDNRISRTKLLNQFAVRSKEFVKRIGRTQSATMFDGPTSSRDKLNSNGVNSLQSSKHCVDCSGSGYVLRARPSQPCDQCKDSLSRYPNFVDALGNMEHQRRDVTRTSDEIIKVTLVNKSGVKLNSNRNQEKPSKAKLGDSNVGENSEIAKGNADSVIGNSGTKQNQKPTEISENQPKENVTGVEDLEGDAIAGDTIHSLADKPDVISTNKKMTSTMIAGENVTTNKEDKSLTDELLLSDVIKKIVSTSSVQNKSVDCTENASNVTLESAKLIQEYVDDEKYQHIPSDTTREHLPLATVVGTTRPNSIAEHGPKETEANFRSDFPPETSQLLHLIPKGTKTKSHQHSTDETTMNKSRKQVDEEDDDVTSTRSNERTTAVHKLDETKNGSRDAESEDSKNLNRTPEEVTDSGYNQIVYDIPQSETGTNVNEEAVGTKKFEQPIPDSGILLQETTTLANLARTTNMRAAIGSVSSNRNLNEETTVAAEVDDREKLNLSPNAIHPSDDNHRQAVNNEQLSERQLNLPVAVHLFPRSTEINNMAAMRSRPVDNVKSIKASDESENGAEFLMDLKRLESEIAASSLRGRTERDDKSDHIQLASTNSAQLNNSTNVATTAVLVPNPEDEKSRKESIAMEINDYEKSVDLPSSSDVVNNRRDNQICLNTPSTAARSVEAVRREYPVSLSTDPMNDRKPNAETVATVDEVLRAGSIKNVRKDIALAPQANEISLSETLKNPNEAGGETDDPVLPGRSKENVIEISAPLDNQSPLSASVRKSSFAPESFDLVSMEHRKTNFIATTKPSLIPPRTNDMVATNNVIPILDQKQDETTTVKQNQIIHTKKEETVSGEGSHKGSSDISVRKPIDNKSSTVLDEALVEEQSLRSDRQFAKVDISDVTEIDHKLSPEGFGYFSDGNIERDRHNVRAVNSTCCRQLLNNEELINRLSEKVLAKLTNKIHRCSPNCKSPCGGFNSYLKAHKDNNLNWE